jgi:hypothetical protein
MITSAISIGGIAYLLAQYLSGKDLVKDPNFQFFSTLTRIGAVLIIGGVPIQAAIISWLIGKKIIKEPNSTAVNLVKTAVSSLRYVTNFFYILLVVTLGITAFLFFNGINVGLKYSLVLPTLSTPAVVYLSFVVITLVAAIIAMGDRLVRKDFQFYIAKMSAHVLGKSSDEDERMRFLRIALNSYDKFIERNLQLEFDVAKILAMIIANDDKKTKITKIVKSFEGADKFNPVISLSEIGRIKDSEPILVKKRIWTTAKEVGTFLAVIIPVLVTVVQLILSYVKFNP